MLTPLQVVGRYAMQRGILLEHYTPTPAQRRRMAKKQRRLQGA